MMKTKEENYEEQTFISGFWEFANAGALTRHFVLNLMKEENGMNFKQFLNKNWKKLLCFILLIPQNMISIYRAYIIFLSLSFWRHIEWNIDGLFNPYIFFVYVFLPIVIFYIFYQSGLDIRTIFLVLIIFISSSFGILINCLTISVLYPPP